MMKNLITHVGFVFMILVGLAFSLGCEKDKDMPAPPPEKPMEMEDTMKMVDQGKTFKLQPADNNKIYHAAFPEFGGTEDQVTKTRIAQFEQLTGREIVWAYFSDNWFDGIKFPEKEVKTIRDAGRIPFIRIMPRSNFNTGAVDPNYSMQSILSGQFDNELIAWAKKAKAIDGPLLAEFGTEVNGNWFPWNAEFNGQNSTSGYGDPGLFDGMERFRDAYRHIIDIFNDQGVNNITWFYHVNAYNGPNESWNNIKDYYPGDEYIDWIGVSIYGPQVVEAGWWTFEDVMDDTWRSISTISRSGKPIALLEWGVIDYPEVGNKAEWITDAIASIAPGGKYENTFSGISYWHSTFDSTNLKLDSSPEALEAYKAAIANDIFDAEIKVVQ